MKAEVAGTWNLSEEDLLALNDAVQTMTADVNQQAQVERETGEGRVKTKFQLRWTLFCMKWNAWFVAHQTFLSRLGAYPEFAEMQSTYTGMRQEWIQIGGSTDAPGNPKPGGMGLVIGAVIVAALAGAAAGLKGREALS